MRFYAFENLTTCGTRGYEDGDELYLAWHGEMSGDFGDADTLLSEIFALLNSDNRPNRFIAPSLSVGDVVTLEARGDEDRLVLRSYSCEVTGWRELDMVRETNEAELDELAERHARAEAAGRPIPRDVDRRPRLFGA